MDCCGVKGIKHPRGGLFSCTCAPRVVLCTSRICAVLFSGGNPRQTLGGVWGVGHTACCFQHGSNECIHFPSTPLLLSLFFFFFFPDPPPPGENVSSSHSIESLKLFPKTQRLSTSPATMPPPPLPPPPLAHIKRPFCNPPFSPPFLSPSTCNGEKRNN